MFGKFEKRMSGTQMIALGFLLLIFIGTILLMLPVSSRNGEWTPFITALFTSTSATCVTGLVLVDTFTHWSIFGQLVLLVLIQIGGLGFITIGITVSLILRKKIGLKQRGLIKESLNTLEIGGVVRLVRRVIGGTFLFEMSGAFILTLRFLKDMDVLHAIYYGIFHSISAFCNAGFSTLSGNLGNPMVMTNHNWLFITVSLLIIFGGIGFPILVNFKDIVLYHLRRFWKLIRTRKLDRHKMQHLYNLNTKIVLIMTFLLLLIGTLAIAAFEWNGSFAGMPVADKWTQAFFNATCPRTAGFSSVDLASLSVQTLLVYLFLMWVGGGSQSTAGGVKVNAFAVVVLNLVAVLRGTERVEVFGRELSYDSIRRSNATVVMSLGVLFIFIFTLSILEPGVSIMALTFECVSALSTVGSSLNLTPHLCDASKLLVSLLMFIGRVGLITLMLGIVKQKKNTKYRYPSDNIIIN